MEIKKGDKFKSKISGAILTVKDITDRAVIMSSEFCNNEAFSFEQVRDPGTMEPIEKNGFDLVGQVATVAFWSDRKVFDIISGTRCSITLRERRAVCDKEPVIEPGGFAGVVKEQPEWHTEPDPGGIIRRAFLRRGVWRLARHNAARVYIGVDSYYYDYGF